MLRNLLYREVKLIYVTRSAWVNAIGCFLLICLLIPLVFWQDIAIVTSVGPLMFWLSIIVSLVFIMNSVFVDDFTSGWLTQILISHDIPEMYFLIKLSAVTLINLLLISLLVPFIGVIYHFSIIQTLMFWLMCLVSFPALSYMLATLSAITVSTQQQNALVLLLAMPLLIPLLLILIAAQDDIMLGVWPLFNILVLLATSITCISICPFVIKYIFKVNCAS